MRSKKGLQASRLLQGLGTEDPCVGSSILSQGTIQCQRRTINLEAYLVGYDVPAAVRRRGTRRRISPAISPLVLCQVLRGETPMLVIDVRDERE